MQFSTLWKNMKKKTKVTFFVCVFMNETGGVEVGGEEQKWNVFDAVVANYAPTPKVYYNASVCVTSK